MQRLTFALLLSLPLACKGGSPKTQSDLPVRAATGGGDATAATHVAKLTPANGERLVLDLRRLPIPGNAAPGGACYDLPPVDFPVGRATCVDEPSASFEILAGQLEITCKTNPDFSVVPARTPRDMSGCPMFEIFAYPFESPIELSVTK